MATEIFLASSNVGKLAEFRILAQSVPRGTDMELHLVPGFRSLPSFEENAPTFAENAAGKALHYSGLCDKLVFADDSGLVVPAVRSVRAPQLTFSGAAAPLARLVVPDPRASVPSQEVLAVLSACMALAPRWPTRSSPMLARARIRGSE